MKNHHHNGPIHPTSPNSRGVIHEVIAASAHALWERMGKPENQSEEIWLLAEQEIVTGHREEQIVFAPPVSF